MDNRSRVALHFVPVAVTTAVVDRVLGVSSRSSLLLIGGGVALSAFADGWLRWQEIDSPPGVRLLSPELGASMYFLPVWLPFGAGALACWAAAAFA